MAEGIIAPALPPTMMPGLPHLQQSARSRGEYNGRYHLGTMRRQLKKITCPGQ
jgi:hypothetical protein